MPAGEAQQYEKFMANRSLYFDVRKRQNLHAAWKVIFANGKQSQSSDTQKQVKEFSENAYRNLERISEKLRKHTFNFAPARGVPIKRTGKTPRPIVIAPIENRVVQRSILEVLQSHSAIKNYVLIPTSYGGLKDERGGKRVQDAVYRAHSEAQNGKSWYIRSDIQSFFTKIVRKKVLETLSCLIDDTEFLQLLTSAITTELDNLKHLGSKAELFPIHEIGVAQGCCLSPLVGNILLHDFDSEMNSRGIVCLRYIDDFLILGSKKQYVEKAFKRAQEILSGLGLSAYDPMLNPEKADIGIADNGFEFLGCKITPEAILPSTKTCNNIINKIDREFKKSVHLMSDPKYLQLQKLSLTDTLKSVNNVLKGWGNQYSFCNCNTIFSDMDIKIDELISKYLSRYAWHRKKFSEDPVNLRRLLGIHPLVDSYSNPRISGFT